MRIMILAEHARKMGAFDKVETAVEVFRNARRDELQCRTIAMAST